MSHAVSRRLDEWRALDRRVWRMAIARAINTAGMSLVMVYLGIYLVVTRGYDAWLYGVVALVANLAQSMTAAWAGELSDRIGRRPLVTGSLVVRAVVIAILGVQVLLEAPLWAMAINFVASSALRGCFEPVAYALVADVCTPEQRIPAYGLQRMGTNLGWALGPTTGGLLAGLLGYGVVFFFAAGGLLAAAATTLDVAESRAPQAKVGRLGLRQQLRDAAGDGPLVALLAASLLAAVVHTQLFSTLSIYLADELGVTKLEIGLVYMVNAGAVLLLQVPAIGWIRRLGVGRAMVGAAVVYAVGFALVGVATGPVTAAVAVVAITLAEVVFAPAHQTAAAETGDAARRGATLGLVSFAQILGVAFAPLIGTSLYDAIGHHHLAMWGVIAAIALGLAATLATYARLRARPVSPPAAPGL